MKPLERIQLRNWREYLDFEIEGKHHKKICVLFERCLIACALYEEFWQKVCLFVYCDLLVWPVREDKQKHTRKTEG